MDVSLTTEIGGLRLKNPFIAASGTVGFIHDAPEIMRLDGFGALVTKTVTLKPRRGNPQPRVWETPCGIINSVGLENPGMETFVSKHLPYLRISDDTVIFISIGGSGIEEIGGLLEHLSPYKDFFDGVELNLSCPNVEGEKTAQSPSEVAKIVELAKEVLPTVPVFVKLTPVAVDIVEVGSSALNAGVDALVLSNTYPALPIDRESLKPTLGNILGGLSGPAIKPLTLYTVYTVYQKLHCPIVASGGITNAEDAIEALAVGASAVQIGVANLINPGMIVDTLKEFRRIISEKGFYSVKELVAYAHQP